MSFIAAILFLLSATVVGPPGALRLSWDPAPDADSYAVQESTEVVPENFNTFALTTDTNTLVLPTRAQSFFRVLSVDTNGLNSLGYYEF